jgi:hypothetical protein
VLAVVDLEVYLADDASDLTCAGFGNNLVVQCVAACSRRTELLVPASTCRACCGQWERVDTAMRHHRSPWMTSADWSPSLNGRCRAIAPLSLRSMAELASGNRRSHINYGPRRVPQSSTRNFYSGTTDWLSLSVATRWERCIDLPKLAQVLDEVQEVGRSAWFAYDWDHDDGRSETFATVLVPSRIIVIEGTVQRSARPRRKCRPSCTASDFTRGTAAPIRRTRISEGLDRVDSNLDGSRGSLLPVCHAAGPIRHHHRPLDIAPFTTCEVDEIEAGLTYACLKGTVRTRARSRRPALDGLIARRPAAERTVRAPPQLKRPRSRCRQLRSPR